MNRVGMIKIAASSLALGAAMLPINASIAGQVGKSAEKVAQQAAKQATKLLAKQKYADAIASAEAAVAASPRDAGYRALLGQAYLSGGRFLSAETMLGEAASLDPTNARTGLNLALAQVATGHNDRALATLDAYRERLLASDFGLAVALAGDAEGSVQVLEAAARVPGADVKTRQNLALAYALAGRWTQSRVMASQDISPAQLDARMTEWAMLASPGATAKRVATLMRVTPVYDPGQPTQLALNPNQPAQTQVAIADPVVDPVPEPVASFSAEPAPVFEVGDTKVAAAAPVAVPVSEPVAEPTALAPAMLAAVETDVVEKPISKIVFGESKPVVQSIPAVSAPLIKANFRPAKQVVVPAVETAGNEGFRPVESGKFVVQLGAYSSEARAASAWHYVSSKAAILTDYDASTARVKVRSASLYRLSVSGFATREVAGQVCARVKAQGGACFVRSIAGDAPLQWAKFQGGTRIAARR